MEYCANSERSGGRESGMFAVSRNESSRHSRKNVKIPVHVVNVHLQAFDVLLQIICCSNTHTLSYNPFPQTT